MKTTQDKIMMDLTSAKFVKLPPVEQLVDKLPAKVYRFKAIQTMAGMEYFLEYSEGFSSPKSLYGNIVSQRDRILKSYTASNKNLGVLLHGIGGTGKSTLAKLIAISVNEDLKQPVILIQGDSIKHMEYLISNLKQPVMFLIDEFEKMFEEDEEQGFLLTLLDGLYNSNHLFVLTANDPERINKYFFNRPSRIRYAFEYKSLPYEVYSEIVNDNFEEGYASELLGKLATINNLSFDIIQEVINEAKQFPELSVGELFEGFNLDKLELEIGNSPVSIYFGENKDKNLCEEIKTIIKKYVKDEHVKISAFASMSNYVSLDEIYDGHFNNNDPLVKVNIYIGDFLVNAYITPDLTKVSEITHRDIKITCSECGVTGIADNITRGLSEILEDINYRDTRDELRKDLAKLKAEDLKLVVNRAFAV